MVATVQHRRHHPRVFPVTGFRTTVLLRRGPYEPVRMGRLRGVQFIHQQYESSASTSRNGIVNNLRYLGVRCLCVHTSERYHRRTFTVISHFLQ